VSVAAETWGAALYGQPCRECGFDWLLSPAAAIGRVREASEQLRRHTASASGHERVAPRTWSVAEYVSHVADNLRNWAERLQVARLDGVMTVGGYDPDELARARGYDAIPLATATWALEVGVPIWADVAETAVAETVVLEHATRGPQHADDVARNNCHDVAHHLWDIEQILSGGP
jgi:hypothetical protein